MPRTPDLQRIDDLRVALLCSPFRRGDPIIVSGDKHLLGLGSFHGSEVPNVSDFL
jgi:hypothetical protein